MKDDVINRQAAIEDAQTWVAVDDHERHLKKDVIEWLKEFPPAQCKTGKWIDDGDPLNWVCSECGYRVARYNNTPYCPYCGAKMEENEDEITLTFNPPITEEQWDIIEDVDFDHTDNITFYTKHGKEVEFVKRKIGKWIQDEKSKRHRCDQCFSFALKTDDGQENLSDYCPVCGSAMKGE